MKSPKLFLFSASVLLVALTSCSNRNSKDYDDNRNAGQHSTSGSTSGSGQSGTKGSTSDMDTAATTSGTSRGTSTTSTGNGNDQGGTTR